MQGRKPIPDNLKALKGTLKKHRVNPNKPTPSDAMPVPPDWLEARAVDHFHTIVGRLVEMDLATSSDTEVIALAAATLAEIEDTTETLAEEGRVWELLDDEGNVKQRRANPAVAQRNEAKRHAQSLLAELGLSPASRSKVSTIKRKPAEVSPFKPRSK